MKYVLIGFVLSILIFCSEANKTSAQVLETNSIVEFDKTNHNKYSWKANTTFENKLINRIAVPKGYKRITLVKNSNADWLRNIQLKPGNPEVYLFNGEKKVNQTAQFAVLDIDVGTKDLQQCADAVMRLRAEYLFSIKKYDDIHFKFTSGDDCSFNAWAKGFRPVLNGNHVSFVKKAAEDYTYSSFKSYLEIIFSYCGTFSLSKELKVVNQLNDLKAGDVFIMGGFPGHAVTVMDVAENIETKAKIFLLSQSYMPAQDIHILKNLTNKDLSPWFSINFGENLETPEWTFQPNTLRSF